jgi:monoamine oxidase
MLLFARLARRFGPRVSGLEALYPGVREQLIADRFMDWSGDAWTAAGYSFPAPGQVTTVGPLLDGAVHPQLRIAGEHACIRFAGYMEGALTSGATVARAIAQRDALPRQQGRPVP